MQALACNFIKKRLWHLCFPVNFAKFLRVPFLTERLCWMLLKGQSDFQTKGLERERERDLKSTDANRNSITISYPSRSSRRDHSIDVSDNIYGCLSGLSCGCFFKIMNFSDRFRQCFKLTTMEFFCENS